MSDRKFQDLVLKAEDELRLLYAKEDVINFMDKISVFYDSVCSAFPNQVIEFMETRKINNFLTQISSISVNRLRKYEGYEMSYDTFEVHLIGKDKSKKTVYLSSIPQFLEKDLLFSKDEFGFFLIVSFLSKQDNYEIVQLFLALK